jgi:hypothetical protein
VSDAKLTKAREVFDAAINNGYTLLPPGTYLAYQSDPTDTLEFQIKGPDHQGRMHANFGAKQFELDDHGGQLRGRGETADGTPVQLAVWPAGQTGVTFLDGSREEFSMVRPLAARKPSALNAFMMQIGDSAAVERDAVTEVAGEVSDQDYTRIARLLSKLRDENESATPIKAELKKWLPLSNAHRAALDALLSHPNEVDALLTLGQQLEASVGAAPELGKNQDEAALSMLRLLDLDTRLAQGGDSSVVQLMQEAKERHGDKPFMAASSILDDILLADDRLDDATRYPYGPNAQSFRDYAVDAFIEAAEAVLPTALVAGWLMAEMASFEAVRGSDDALNKGSWSFLGKSYRNGEAVTLPLKFKKEGENWGLSLTLEGKKHQLGLRPDGNGCFVGDLALECSGTLEVTLGTNDLLNGRAVEVLYYPTYEEPLEASGKLLRGR